MAPNKDGQSPNLTKRKEISNTSKQDSEIISVSNLEKKKADFKPEIVWRNVIIFVVLHLMAFYGVYCCFHAKTQTLIFGRINFSLIV